jgi:hypothetical protein
MGPSVRSAAVGVCHSFAQLLFCLLPSGVIPVTRACLRCLSLCVLPSPCPDCPAPLLPRLPQVIVGDDVGNVQLLNLTFSDELTITEARDEAQESAKPDTAVSVDGTVASVSADTSASLAIDETLLYSRAPATHGRRVYLPNTYVCVPAFVPARLCVCACVRARGADGAASIND